MTDAPIAARAPAYRGFLFSDIRGFTAFGERYGNDAAAAAVARFLEIARRAIASYEGAEIKTEGDAIHAVFPSASSAVLCGLEIVEGAAEVNARQADRPVGFGVGVHAGEAVETAEGYIGRAVNIAARLCAQARPGEVLVSSTVKGITQASIPVGFIPRGTKRLKGINDPILVYAVTRDPNAKAPREVRRPLLLGAAGAAAVAVVAIAALVGSRLLPGSGANATSGAALPTAPARQPVFVGALPIGTYVSTAFQPAVGFRIVDPGWAASLDQPSMLALVRESSPRGSVSFLRVRQVIESPCGPGEESASAPPTAADLLTQLAALPHVTLTDRKPTQLGGLAGEMVDVHVADGALAACSGLAGDGVSLFDVGGEVWSAASGELFRLIAVGGADQAVTAIVSADWTTTPSVQEVENVFNLGGKILNTVDFRRR
ncbi:MAG TPA: adenylate/guanylate cyclase domain-containing protein [Patescibacteria group bacterium]|nr:adenylate/guanylate cyclase domain-containing protein [Patescibacteria group bacterium]